MGELIEVGRSSGGALPLVSTVVSVLALGIYALLQGDGRNDDDDSGPGGGLMQPVA
ncbi:MAG: hypothetical protein WBN89_14010 [Prochlorococcaceae cyanobacterium]